jgi:hypothetical protein
MKPTLLQSLKWCLIFIFCCHSVIGLSQNQKKEAITEFESSINSPQKIIKVAQGHYFIDFGKAYFGTLILRAKQNQNDTLLVSIGEKLSGKHTIDTNPGGTIRYQQTHVYGLQANKEEVVKLFPDKRNSNPPAIQLPDSFGIVMPFRYCEIENIQIPIEDLIIQQKAYYYPFNDDAGLFFSSDTVLNQVWDLCKHTIKATTFTGYYIDGDRERIPYEADAYINQLSHYCVDSIYSIARRTNEYFIDHPTWPTEWLLHTVMLYYQDYMYTGDVSQLEKYYEVLKVRTLQELAGEDGLISSQSEKLTPELKKQLGFDNPQTQIKDIVDWPPARGNSGKKWLPEFGERDGYEMVEVNTVVNAFYYHNLVLLSEIAEVLGNQSDAELFKQKSAKVKVVINHTLFDAKRGVYIDGEGSDHASLHANMFPLAFDLVPDEYRQSVVDFIKSRGMVCSVYGAQYLLEGLFKAGEASYALHLINDTSHDRTWWNMIKLGSTMTLEAWDQKYKPNLDWNHAWGTAPLNIMTRYMWGIRPQSPGFANVQIKPQLSNLTFCDIKVPTIKGSIIASYKTHKKNNCVFEIELPASMKGEFILPNHYLLRNTKKYKLSKGIIQLNKGKNLIKLRYKD